jgi:hypothetical protein
VARNAFPGTGASSGSKSGAPSAARARLALATGLSASLIALLVAFVAPAAASSGGCPNEARREEQGAAGRALPDCRAYELVTPPGAATPQAPSFANGYPPFYPYLDRLLLPFDKEGFQASVGGQAMAYSARDASSQSLNESNLAKRGPDGWSAEGIAPPQSRLDFLCVAATGFVGYSADLSQGVLIDGLSEASDGAPINAAQCGHDEPRLVPGESEDSANIFLRDTASGSYRLLTPAGVAASQPQFDAISADGSHVVFEEKVPLTPEAPSVALNEKPAERDIYVWNGNALHLLTILPDGSAALGQLAGAAPDQGFLLLDQTGAFSHAVSRDGERIYFYAGGNFASERGDPTSPYVGGGLYLRLNAGQARSEECVAPSRACTIQIDVPEAGAPDPAGDGQFKWASADGSKVFFTDDHKLTSTATAEAGKPDLYEYDLEKPAGQRLTDLTVNTAEPADVQGFSGASEDGSYLYFVADGVLTGTEQNSQHAEAQPGRPNLYLGHAGATRYIATLDPAAPDRCDWIAACLTARVSSNGAYIAFNSLDSLTGYDNTPLHLNACKYVEPSSEPTTCLEVFRYAAAAAELDCVSCNPNGAPPDGEFAESAINEPSPLGALWGREEYLAHNVSDNGQVFFDTMNRLLPADENETYDAYEYEGGQLHLISSGTSEFASWFLDATPNASDAFLAAYQQLVRSDTNTNYVIFDARVGGGFPEPLIPPCESESCRGPGQTPPTESTPSSANFSGTEEGRNHPRCEKGFVLRHGKCARKRHRHHRRAHHRAARNNRGAGQ